VGHLLVLPVDNINNIIYMKNKNNKEARYDFITVRMNKAERLRTELSALDLNVSMSEYIRQKLNNKQ